MVPATPRGQAFPRPGVQPAQQRTEDGIRPAIAPGTFARHELGHQHRLPGQHRHGRIGRTTLGRESALGQGPQHPGVALGRGHRPRRGENSGHPVGRPRLRDPVDADVQLGDPGDFDAVLLLQVRGQLVNSGAREDPTGEPADSAAGHETIIDQHELLRGGQGWPGQAG